jgi:hypothetical protein
MASAHSALQLGNRSFPERVAIRPSMTWWLWRGACTRSHPELGRENPQRQWYFVSRRGRVGRRQVFKVRIKLHQNPPSPKLRRGGQQSQTQKARSNKKRAFRASRPRLMQPAREGRSPEPTNRATGRTIDRLNAGWSSPVARQAHNLKVVGSNPTPATNQNGTVCKGRPVLFSRRRR